MSTKQFPQAAMPAASRRRAAGPRAQRGNAMLWYMLASVLVGIAAVYGYDMYRDGERNTAIDGLTKEVTGVIGEAKATFGQYGFAGLTSQVAAQSRLFPRSRVNAAGDAGLNQFGGAITLIDNNATLAQSALLTYASVPQDLCVKVVTMTERLARGVSVAGVVVKAVGAGAAVNVVTLGNQCISADPVTIAWTIGRV